MGSSEEESRKRRDWKAVEQEEARKVRVLSKVATTPSRNLSPNRRLAKKDDMATDASVSLSNAASITPSRKSMNTTTKESSEDENQASTAASKVWDLESALQYLVQVESNVREFISNSTYVTFRVGHAGDASTIASLYRQSQRVNYPEQSKEEGQEELLCSTSMLELWLAEGMGDEDTPPSVYCLMAHCKRTSNSNHVPESDQSSTLNTDHDNASEAKATASKPATLESSASVPIEGTNISMATSLGAVALITLQWSDGNRMLRVEWLYIDPALDQEVAKTLEGRVWLRLSTLALMTSCTLVGVDGDLTSAGAAKSARLASHLLPSAE